MNKTTTSSQSTAALASMDHPALVSRSWNGTPISRRTIDGYVNATAMCKANGKQWSKYRESDSCQTDLDARAETSEIRMLDLIETRPGPLDQCTVCGVDGRLVPGEHPASPTDTGAGKHAAAQGSRGNHPGGAQHWLVRATRWPIRIPLRSDSSRMVEIPSSFLSLTRSAVFLIMSALLT